MLCKLPYRLWSVSWLAATISCKEWGHEKVSGRTHLWGNSFGVPGADQTFDYVIVGAGTAGSVLAARLAQDPAGYSVAVVEAGSFYEFQHGNLTQVPGYNGWSVQPDKALPSLIEWDIETTPQVGLNGRTLHYAQGRALGGTTAINSLGYHRATVGTFRMWADAVGDEGWNWENVYSYYKKSCNFTPPNFDRLGQGVEIPYDSDAFVAGAGPVHISYGNYRADYVNPVSNALGRIGLPKISGLNSGSLIGYAPITLTIDPGLVTRSSAETSFLQMALKRSKLRIFESTLAKKILFDENKKASGVLVVAKGQREYPFTINANREVILAAGVLRSPQLLMVSGIGPKKILEDLEIPVISPLEGVGKNLWDAPYYRLSHKVNVTTLTQLENPEYHTSATEAYLTTQSGVLSGNNAGEVIGWEKLPDPYRSRLSRAALEYLDTFADDWPEIELLPFGAGPRPDDSIPTAEDNRMSFAAGLLTPKSRGTVTINSTDTNDQPIVDVNFLHDPIDQEIVIQAFRRTREWAAAVEGMTAEEYSPGPEVTTDEQILSWLKKDGPLVYHATSTCAMGKTDNPDAVLDSQARVYGVSKLRVVDASSLPFLVPGHPMATIYMLAEKLADMILQDGPPLLTNQNLGEFQELRVQTPT